MTSWRDGKFSWWTCMMHGSGLRLITHLYPFHMKNACFLGLSEFSHASQDFPTEGMRGGGIGGKLTLVKNLSIPPPHQENFSTTKGLFPPTNNNFYGKTNKNFIFSCSHFYLNFILFVHTGHAKFDFNQYIIFTKYCF